MDKIKIIGGVATVASGVAGYKIYESQTKTRVEILNNVDIKGAENNQRSEEEERKEYNRQKSARRFTNA